MQITLMTDGADWQESFCNTDDIYELNFTNLQIKIRDYQRFKLDHDENTL